VGQIALFDERDVELAHREVARDADTRRPAADYENVWCGCHPIAGSTNRIHFIVTSKRGVADKESVIDDDIG
jgi:hypothetical protein